MLGAWYYISFHPLDHIVTHSRVIRSLSCDDGLDVWR